MKQYGPGDIQHKPFCDNATYGVHCDIDNRQ